VLDEMPKMQKLDAVIKGPDLGRGQKVSYLIIGQDIHQIQEKYGADAAATIISTTAAKIVLRQNDPETAKTFSRMMGMEMTKKVETDKDGKKIEKPEEKPVYSEMDIMKLPFGKQLVIFQGHYNRPIEAEAALFFKNKTPVEQRLTQKMQMGEASPLPEFLIPSHHAIMGYDGTPKLFDPNTKEIKILEPLKS
jgi:type IV secretory pathway TraG/TraD family ATPase VirD4